MRELNLIMGPPTAVSGEPESREARLARVVRRVAPVVLRYALVFLILLWGVFKFFEFEALAIMPLVENSPLLDWMYPVFGVRGASALIGAIEVVIGVAIAFPRANRRLSAYASLAAAGMFLTTLSFLFTTPSGFTGPFAGFLMKDLVLLGAALVTAGESFARAEQPLTNTL
jgi:uncharacterized membrane protein YkgB